MVMQKLSTKLLLVLDSTQYLVRDYARKEQYGYETRPTAAINQCCSMSVDIVLWAGLYHICSAQP